MDNNIQNSSLLDLTGLLRGEVRELDFDMTLSPELDVEAIAIDAPPRIKGKAVNLSGYITFDAELTVKYTTHCSRCLKEVSTTMKQKIFSPIAEKLENMDNEEYIIPEQNVKINLDDIAREAFFLNLPMTHLCKKDCKGLCAKCGKDKNEGDCGCVIKEKDPRWKALEGFFDED
jgi:uncharacterized protein